MTAEASSNTGNQIRTGSFLGPLSTLYSSRWRWSGSLAIWRASHHVIHPTHAAHATQPWRAMAVAVVVAAGPLGGFDNDAIGREQEDGDFRRVLQSGALDLGRGEDAGFEDVGELAGEGVPAFA